MRLFTLELPVLQRELTEQASRRRTYIVRVLSICAMALVIWRLVATWAPAESDVIGVGTALGAGGPIFDGLVSGLFWCIKLLMPALCCAVVTAEKERNTMGILLTTKLTPGNIVLEKLLSRVFPMLTILLLVFPVLGYLYSLGGVDLSRLSGTFWLLVVECFLMASIALMYSCWFPTTAMAFIWSYVTVSALLFTNVLSFQPSGEGWILLPSAIWHLTDPAATFGELLISTIPALIVISHCLLFSRLFLVRRAFVSDQSAALRLFRVLDTFFRWLNERTTGGIEIVRDRSDVPLSRPLTWREESRKALGKARYLFRILVVLQVPTVFLCTLAAIASSDEAFRLLFFIEYILWALAALILIVKSSTLISSEYARETMSALLATPLTASEILFQKMLGMRRLMCVLAVPMLTVTLTHYLLFGSYLSLQSISYLLISLASIALMQLSVALVGTIVGTQVRSQTKSVLVAISVLATWTTIPVIAGQFTSSESTRNILVTFSPYSLLESTERYLTGLLMFGRNWTYEDTQGKNWWFFVLLIYSTTVSAGLLFIHLNGHRLLGRPETHRS